jgi:hypothetical protein
MKTPTIIEQREAQFGERMIEIKIRFWTDNLADSEGTGFIQPKHAWSAGVVRMERNKSHGIVPQSPVPFNSLMDLTAVIEKVLLAQGITLHASRKMHRYFDTEK